MIEIDRELQDNWQEKEQPEWPKRDKKLPYSVGEWIECFVEAHRSTFLVVERLSDVSCELCSYIEYTRKPLPDLKKPKEAQVLMNCRPTVKLSRRLTSMAF